MFDQINKKKKMYEAIMVWGWIFAVVLFIVIMGNISNYGEAAIKLSIYGCAGVGTIGTLIGKGGIKKLSVDFKKKYVPGELTKIFPNGEYFCDKGFTENEVVNSKLLKKEDRFNSEDMITGDFNDVRFRCSDVHIQDVRRSGKTTTVVTTFQGRFYEFDFFKNFKHNLVLLQSGRFRSMSGFNKIKLESVEFNNEFKIYAKNDHEAFYILTPHFMEKLLKLDEKYHDKISFSFLNNKLFIAIDDRKDSFDFKAFGSDVNQKLIDSYVYEFEAIKDFIEYLRLDSRLFK